MLAKLNTAIRSVFRHCFSVFNPILWSLLQHVLLSALTTVFFFLCPLQTCKLNTLFSIGEDFDDEVTVRKHTWFQDFNLISS